MLKSRSFKHIVGELYYNEIFNELSMYIQDNASSLDEIVLSDICIKGVHITDSEDMEILFEIIVSAELEVTSICARERESRLQEKWVKISCKADLDDGVHNFKILSISAYQKCRRNNKPVLTDTLVPIISKDEFDKVAEQFLQEFYPEALNKPMALPVKEIANRMGLSIKELQITRHLSIFGQVTFGDCVVDYFDDEDKSYKKMKVDKGTIILDPNAYFMRNIGNVNNTVIHECVHWYKHRKHHELEKLHTNNARLISCRVSEITKRDGEWTPKDWMEWQANGLAPRILMPKKTTVLKIKELIEKNIKLHKKKLDVMENVVCELAEFFEVSRAAAKIRMLDLGYREVEGVYCYMDGKYLSTYAFNEQKVDIKQTFTINAQDACALYMFNLEFKDYINSGKYVYIEGHFCLNHPKYVAVNQQGYMELTDYAYQHMDECCLMFNITLKGKVKFNVAQYLKDVMYRNVTCDTIMEADFTSGDHNNYINNVIDFSKNIRETVSILKQLPTTFPDTLVAHMKRKGYTVDKLAEKTLLSAKTIQRLRNDEEYETKIETVIAVCIGLQLNGQLSNDLIRKSGCSFKMIEKHIAYQMFLQTYYMKPIHEFNEMLELSGIEALGKAE